MRKVVHRLYSLLGKGLTFVWLPVTVIVVWIFVSGDRANYYMPRFGETISGVSELLSPEGMKRDVLPTLANMLTGFGIAVVVGVILGVLIGRISIVRELTSPLISFFRSVPPPALLPLAIVLLGIGAEMKIALIAFGALWPTLLSTIDAVRNQDPGLDDLARVYAIRRSRKLAQMTIPAAAPQIVAGMRTSLLYAITLIVLSEMVASSFGLGYSVLLAQRTFQISDMWAAIILLGLLGLVLNSLFVVFERVVLRWHLSRNSERGETWIA